MALDEYRKQVASLSVNDQKLRNLYLRKLALGELQGPPTGYPSLDNRSLQFFSEEQIKAGEINKTAYEYLYEENKNYENDVAVLFLGKKIKYKELFKRIDDVARSLKQLGVQKGETVTICLPNTPESAYLFYACSKIGAIADFIDPRENEEGMEKYLNISNAKHLFMLDMCYENFNHLIKKKGIENVIVTSALETLPSVIMKGLEIKEKLSDKEKVKRQEMIRNSWKESARVTTYKEFIKEGKKYNGLVEEPYEANRPVAIVHTGGTTGIPKGVLLSNDNLNELTNQIKNCDIQFKRHYMLMGVMPEFVGYGLSVGLHTSLVIGMKTMMVPKYEPEKIPAMILKYKPNCLAGSPAHWEIFSKSPLITDDVDLSFFKAPIEGGDTLNIKIEKKVNEILEKHNCNYKLQKGYGMTEKCSAATVCFNNDVNFIGQVGAPFTKTLLSVVDENNNELGYNQVGEICVSAPDVMLGYYNNQDETDKVLIKHSDGRVWLHSGDLGYITEDGLLKVEGRKKDIVIRYDGIKIYPFNVESILLKHPSIKSVAVIGIADPEHLNGEIPIAYVSLNEGCDEKSTISSINDYALKYVADYAVPSEYITMDNLPKTQVGKVDKKKLKNIYSNSKNEKILKR